MSESAPVPRYGVLRQTTVADDLAAAAESIGTLGFAVLDAGFTPKQIDELSFRFDQVHSKSLATYGADRLRALDEHNTIRCPLSLDPVFLSLAMNPRILALAKLLMQTGVTLNQQNGIINPGSGATYNQAYYHRDLPYQHFVSSRPIAINALYCVDDFTLDNGSTLVVPATHKVESFPSDDFVRMNERAVTAPAGAFIVLDCMLYHCGGQNRSGRDRWAVNHVYSIGLMKQQIDLPRYLGKGYSSDPEVRSLLGYGASVPNTLEEYYTGREARLRNK